MCQLDVVLPWLCSGEINFGEMMNMFRDDLLDLNAILDYIKMAPVDESASSTSSMVRPPASRQHCTCDIVGQVGCRHSQHCTVSRSERWRVPASRMAEYE